MVFPQTVLPLNIELDLDGVWTSVPVYRRQMCNITRGRSDEAGQVDRSSCQVEIDNRSHNYSPRNPTSIYYGILGRNTPLRISLDGPTTYLEMHGLTGERITTPDTAALDIVGDLDVAIEVSLHNWRKGQDLAGKYETTGNQRSWAFYLHADNSGTPVFTWSANGTATLNSIATKALPAPGSGRQAVRATIDVNNGAGGNTVTFYYADTIAGPWTQLGDPVITASTTSIFSSSAVLEVGDVEDLLLPPMAGQIHKFELRNSIGGTLVARPDFTAQTDGATSFADAAGRTWTKQGSSLITNKDYRFSGEVASWPVAWDGTGEDVSVTIEANGVMRRLGQGVSISGSTMYRGLLRDTEGLVAYWPIEDVEGSTSIAPGLSTHGPMSVIGGAMPPALGINPDFVASDPLAVLAGSSFVGQVPSYTYGTQTQIRFLLEVPLDGAENNQVILMFYTTGTVRRWEVHYGTGGTLGLRAFDSGNTQLFDSGDVAFGIDGQLLRISVELTQNGTAIDWNLLTLEVGAPSGLQTNGTLASNTVGKVGGITLSPGGGIEDMVVGHLSVQNVITTLFDIAAQLAGWSGELAGRRIERLCAEEGIPFQGRGNLDDTTRMGIQKPSDFLTLIRECADADMGMLFEPRNEVGLGYRTRTSMYNQTATVLLNYPSSQIASPMSPTDDDQRTRNDVTVTRVGGSSARAVLEEGPLSVQSPPNGVGRYDTSESINLQHDLDLFDQANWRLRLGTVDEARYPTVDINLARTQVFGNATLLASLHAMEAGDKLEITNPPPFLPPDTISQIVQGYSEVMGNYEHALVINCAPAAPYDAAVYGTGSGTVGPERFQPDSSVLAEDMTTTETGMDVATTVGPLWTTAAGEFPFDIMVGGERMTITAISGSSSPQTFTVTRSVNGIVKTHATGAQVEMFRKSVYAL